MVPADWVSTSVQEATISWDRFAEHYMHTGYGYQWWGGQWDGPVSAYVATGWGGQFIFVLPELDLGVVVTGCPGHSVRNQPVPR